MSSNWGQKLGLSSIYGVLRMLQSVAMQQICSSISSLWAQWVKGCQKCCGIASAIFSNSNQCGLCQQQLIEMLQESRVPRSRKKPLERPHSRGELQFLFIRQTMQKSEYFVNICMHFSMNWRGSTWPCFGKGSSGGVSRIFYCKTFYVSTQKKPNLAQRLLYIFSEDPLLRLDPIHKLGKTFSCNSVLWVYNKNDHQSMERERG